MIDVSFLPQAAFAFLLIFARLGIIMMLAPGFGENSVPVRIRLVFALSLTVLIFPVVSGQFGALPEGLLAALWLFVFELMIGFFFGMTVRLLLSILAFAGTVIAYQSGLAFAQNVDPSQGTQGALFGNFLIITAITMIFATEMHHLMIAGMVMSYDILPPGIIIPIGDMAQVVLRTVAETFVVGLQISAPFLLFGFVFYFGLGLLARLMPQLQVFFIAMPLNNMLGFVMFALLMGAMLLWFIDHYERTLNALFFAF